MLLTPRLAGWHSSLPSSFLPSFSLPSPFLLPSFSLPPPFLLLLLYCCRLECTIKLLIDTSKTMDVQGAQGLLATVKRYLDALENLKELARLASKRIEIQQGDTGHSFQVRTTERAA